MACGAYVCLFSENCRKHRYIMRIYNFRFMEKKLLQSVKEWKKLKEYLLCDGINASEYTKKQKPSKYPCICVYEFLDGFYEVIFIYLNDFA